TMIWPMNRGCGPPPRLLAAHTGASYVLIELEHRAAARPRFAHDSPLEGTGFELVVPLRDWYRSRWCQRPRICLAWAFPRTFVSLSSARISRRFSGFCRLCERMYSHIWLTTFQHRAGVGNWQVPQP